MHAIECARQALEGSDFILFLADEVLLNGRHQAMIDAFSDPGTFALCGVVEVEDPVRITKTYGLIYDESNGRIFRLIEKPRRPLNNTQGTGNCMFRNEIFYLEGIGTKPTYGEKGPIKGKRGDDGIHTRSIR